MFRLNLCNYYKINKKYLVTVKKGYNAICNFIEELILITRAGAIY